MNKLKDLKTFQKGYCDIKPIPKCGGVGMTYFKVYKEGFQEILDFINQNYISKQQILNLIEDIDNSIWDISTSKTLDELKEQINKL